MSYIRMAELDLRGKRVLIRQDLNVPIKDGRVTNDKRIRASLPTIEKALKQGSQVILMSHLGRPIEGEYAKEFSLAPIAKKLSELIGKDVMLKTEWINGIEFKPGEIILCENVRFQIGEKENSLELGKKMAALCDVYVMDAFGTAHRAQASTHSVAQFAPVACAGPLLAGELDALGRALESPLRPILAVVGGSKVSTKLTVLSSLMDKVDQIIVGGGIANTFIAASGFPVGESLYEKDLIPEAQRLMKAASDRGCKIPLPVDMVCTKEFSETAESVVRRIGEVKPDEMILDIGPDTAANYAVTVNSAGTIVWNGPVGVFEIDQFSRGTRSLGTAIASSQAFSIAGGGDTLAAIDQFELGSQISYASTGGGAFLEFLEGKKLPAVAILEDRNT